MNKSIIKLWPSSKETKHFLSGLNVIFKAIYPNFEDVPEIKPQEHGYDLMPDQMAAAFR